MANFEPVATLADLDQQILALWRDGKNISEIAEQLGIGESSAVHLVDRALNTAVRAAETLPLFAEREQRA